MTSPYIRAEAERLGIGRPIPTDWLNPDMIYQPERIVQHRPRLLAPIGWVIVVLVFAWSLVCVAAWWVA